MINTIAAWKRSVRTLSLKSKLFITLILLSLIPAFCIGYVSQYLIIRSSSNGAAALSSQIVKYIANDINAYLVSINESLNTFVIDSEFQKFLTVPKNDIQMQAGYAINFRPLLQLLAQSKKEIRGVLYLDKLGKIYLESQKVHMNINYPLYEDSAYKAITAMTEVSLTQPHPQAYALNDQREVVTFVKPANLIRENTLAAWILVEIDAQWIRDIMDKTKFGDNGQVLLYDPSNGTAMINGPKSAMLDDLIQRLQGGTLLSDEFVFTHAGVSYQVAYDTIRLGNWRFVGVIPLEEMTAGVRHSRIITLLIAFASFILALFIAYPLMGIVLQPLYRLKYGMQMLGRGTSVPIQHAIPDEIGFLIKTYNQMLGDLDTMRKEVVDTKLREKEKELLQLQAQINPHFLFNTLETVESYSLHNDGAAVSDMLQCVSRMLRYNVRNDGGWASLREEIKYIYDFLCIHNYRNAKRVNTSFTVPEELLDMPVMKLSIQPFVENSLKYGWNPLLSEEDFELSIVIRSENGRLIIRIQDNGIGISDEVYGMLTNLTQSDGTDADPFFRKHTGTLNVYRRYLLVYGSGFNMQFLRGVDADKGTAVVITIPERAAGENFIS
jgi:two-component system sensor histidine kinase YesM